MEWTKEHDILLGIEDYIERKEEQERESEKISDKTAKEKASAEEMRNKAMERLGETKKREGDDQRSNNIHFYLHLTLGRREAWILVYRSLRFRTVRTLLELFTCV